MSSKIGKTLTNTVTTKIAGAFKKSSIVTESSPTYDPLLEKKFALIVRALKKQKGYNAQSPLTDLKKAFEIIEKPDLSLKERATKAFRTLTGQERYKNLAPFKSLKKAYGTMHPETRQLKTISFGPEIAKALPKNLVDPDDPQKTISLKDHELAKIKKLAKIAGDFIETRYGRPSPISMLRAQRIAETRSEEEQTASSHKQLLEMHKDEATPNPSYGQLLNMLATECLGISGKSSKDDIKNKSFVYPRTAAPKFADDATTINIIAQGKTPNPQNLEFLIDLKERLNAASLMVERYEKKEEKENKIDKVDTEDMKTIIQALLDLHDDKQHGLAALTPTINKLYGRINEGEEYTVIKRIQDEPTHPS